MTLDSDITLPTYYCGLPLEMTLDSLIVRGPY